MWTLFFFFSKGKREWKTIDVLWNQLNHIIWGNVANKQKLCPRYFVVVSENNSDI